MEHVYTMIGYRPNGKPLIEPVKSTDHAREVAGANGVTRYFLIPECQGHDHLGYLLRDGEYKKVWLAEMLQTLCPKTLRVVGR